MLELIMMRRNVMMTMMTMRMTIDHDVVMEMSNQEKM